MPKQTWYIAAILSLLAVLAFVGLTSWQRSAELEKTLAEMARTRTLAEQAAQQFQSANQKLAEKEALVAQLEQERQESAKAQKGLEDQMRASLQSKDITISQLQGKLTVNILDRILFDSGEVLLKPEGEQILVKIAGVLSQFPNRQIHVVGHTDDVPLSANLRQRFPSNWELSTARATAAVRFLEEKASVDPRRIGAVGYGEFHPLAPNTTAEGRALNRRIALVVLPEELAGADIPPSAGSAKPKPALETPAPPVPPAPAPAPALAPAPAPTPAPVPPPAPAPNPSNPTTPPAPSTDTGPFKPVPAVPPAPVPPLEAPKKNP